VMLTEAALTGKYSRTSLEGGDFAPCQQLLMLPKIRLVRPCAMRACWG
jgi:hypothetical protein